MKAPSNGLLILPMEARLERLISIKKKTKKKKSILTLIAIMNEVHNACNFNKNLSFLIKSRTNFLVRYSYRDVLIKL